MPRFFGYCRASTSGQQYTFEAQKKAISAAYERVRDDYEFGGFFEDHAVSGIRPFTERPEGLKVWVLAQKGDIICFSKMDRAFRCAADAANLINMCNMKGIGLMFIDLALDTSTALGKFVAQLMACVAELERHWISQRTREALAIRKASGTPHSRRPPVGWRKSLTGNWVPDKTERKLIDWAIEQHDKGLYWDQIVSILRAKGITRANGDKYHQCWFHYAVKAKEAGYPGRDNWRTVCSEEARRNRIEQAKKVAEKKLKNLQRSPSTCPSDSELSSSQSEDPGQTPCQTP